MSSDSPSGTASDDGVPQLMAAAGVASRRPLQNMIEAGRVEVNGEVVTELRRRRGVIPRPGRRVAIQLDTSRRYLMLQQARSELSPSLQDDRGRPDLQRALCPGLTSDSSTSAGSTHKPPACLFPHQRR
jgi:23S rRNA pseudouridine2605 synthase/16S rRNA pseudouridine516 synthase